MTGFADWKAGGWLLAGSLLLTGLPACSGDGSCAYDTDCPGSKYCIDGECVALPEDCPNEDCEDGYVCVEDECVEVACLNVRCDTPPPDACDGDTRVAYQSPGTCAAGSCSYPGQRQDCELGCLDGACIGDPCGSVICEQGQECVDGACECIDGRADCRAEVPGCETELGTLENCTACGERCRGAGPCQIDVCDPQAGCTRTDSTGSCDDGDPCTHTDRCSGGSCAGTRITCRDDPGVCGAERECNGTATCSETFPPASTTCDDGSLCTESDHCDGAGHCTGSPTVSCGPHAHCNPADGGCYCDSPKWGQCNTSWDDGCETDMCDDAHCGEDGCQRNCATAPAAAGPHCVDLGSACACGCDADSPCWGNMECRAGHYCACPEGLLDCDGDKVCDCPEDSAYCDANGACVWY